MSHRFDEITSIGLGIAVAISFFAFIGYGIVAHYEDIQTPFATLSFKVAQIYFVLEAILFGSFAIVVWKHRDAFLQ